MSNEVNVCIVILNWNGWRDTIECLESTFKLDYIKYQVVVCDNNSTDGSLGYIKEWADGRLNSYVSLENKLRIYSFPPISKPIAYREYTPHASEFREENNDNVAPLILIQTGNNLGFAGGNNFGLRYFLANERFEYVWLLNNDTVIQPDTLKYIVNKAENYKSKRKKIGIIGSKLKFYYSPITIQAVGAVYSTWSATTRHIGLNEIDQGQFDREEITEIIDYPVGASLFVSRLFINDTGLMCEDFFLYYEELDWILRGKSKGWEIGYCWQANIYHKEGASIGSSSKAIQKSVVSDYFSLRNRLIFTKKFFPKKIWIVRASFIFVLINRLRRFQFSRIRLVAKAFFNNGI
jgi:hypothetical protein